MNQTTLGQAKIALSPFCGATGMNVADPRVVSYINKAVLELSQTGDYPGVVDRWFMRFNQQTGLVALPYYFDRMMQVTTDGCPRMIASPWFEFVGYGPGIQDDYDARGNLNRTWISTILDRGESPVQRQIPDLFELTGPWTLRVYATVDEQESAPVAPTINIQGLDQNGLIIRSLSNGTGDTEWVNGVNYPIDIAQPFTTTGQEFSKVTGVSKPETNGYVRVTAWNGTVEIELSNYAFNETTPTYRHYYVPNIRNLTGDTTTIRILQARCRKRWVPAWNDEDILMIGNLNALEEMIIAQWKRLSDREDYATHKTEAVVLMRAEAAAYYGKSRVPAISFQKGFSLGAIPFAR